MSDTRDKIEFNGAPQTVEIRDEHYEYFHEKGPFGNGDVTVVLGEECEKLFEVKMRLSEIEIIQVINVYRKAYSKGQDFGEYKARKNMREALGFIEHRGDVEVEE